MFWRFFKKKSGFTVIEMLVVLGITAVLSSLFVGYGVNLKDQIALFRDEAQIIQMLFRVKTFAIQVRSDNGETACAYGVHIEDDGQYFIYQKDKPLSDNCDDLGGSFSWNNGTGSTVIGQVRRLDSRIEFDGASSDELVFIPPRPEVDEVGSFVICTTDEGINRFCREITLNRVGQIDSGRVN